MSLFRIYLVLLIVGLGAYTLVVGSNHGWNLLPIFFSNITSVDWQGQFNLDFMTFLSLSALWVAWRHQFSAAGCLLGVIAFFGGMMFLAPYLIWASFRTNGSVGELLVGANQASK
ncbi:hypothetical protein [Limnobacter sp. MED105]|uniref:hypothetical protein n=1 Tax=Limnobacter sp. MED105 TaxID=391597 RepID=UPI000156C97C|nr:hypothetical protein [Limnobacter sp. MED105]EDM83214.1 hypothetical protein LMED105_09885 [Limnobacter sp. MED105]